MTIGTQVGVLTITTNRNHQLTSLRKWEEWAHRTPSNDGPECRITGTFRPHTIAALFRCPMVCPLTIAWFGEDFRELQTCCAVRTPPHIASCTVEPICRLGSQPCRAIH
jgi:hypothetical protein